MLIRLDQRMCPLSIAIFGNTNNYLLLLAQGLKALGHSVRLIINRKELLHRPEARYPQWADCYPDWIFDCSYITDDDISYKTPAIYSAIQLLTHNIDLVILNDAGPALFEYLKSPHFVILTGSDLAYYADYDSIEMRTSMWDPAFKKSSKGQAYISHYKDLVSRQKKGILSAKTVCYGQRGLVPKGDQLLDEIGVQDRQRLMLYISNTLDLKAQASQDNACLTILCGSRIVFKQDKNLALSALDFKGTDVLITGFAQFIKNGGHAVLKLPRKGQDLEIAVSLISDLGIEKNVEFLDEMPLIEFYKQMIGADLICDQFGTSFPGMVSTDAFALGRPVMANLRNDIFGQRFPEPLPGFDAKTPEQIAEHLISLERNRNLLVCMGRKSRVYAEKYLSPIHMAEQLLETIETNV